MMEIMRAMFKLMVTAHSYGRDCTPYAQMLVDELVEKYRLKGPPSPPPKYTADSPTVHETMKTVNDAFGRTYRGNKIQMIMVYRAMTGAGLKESKDFVEQHGYHNNALS